MADMNILILFKYPLHWNENVLHKFSIIGKVQHIFLSEFSVGYSKKHVVHRINKIIKESAIEVVIFDTDFQCYIDNLFIHKIAINVVKVCMTFDDLLLRGLNEITFEACDVILTPDLLAVYKYQEIGKCASLMLLEGSCDIYYKKMGLAKTIEVLTFGSLEKADRRIYLDFLRENGISVTTPPAWVSQNELVDLINSSKIVINFSKTNYLDTKGSALYKKKSRQKFLYQFKGRIIEAGLCGTACVSEYSPMGDIIFTGSEVSSFRSKEECLERVNELLYDPDRRELMATRLQAKILSLYEDRVAMQKIKLLLEEAWNTKKMHRGSGSEGLPFWYVESMYQENLYKNFMEYDFGNFAQDLHFFYTGYGYQRNLLTFFQFTCIAFLAPIRLLIKKISKFISSRAIFLKNSLKF